MNKLFKILLLLSLSIGAMAEDKKSSDEIDFVALAALLLKDGYIERANEALNNIKLEEQKEEIDLVRYYTLRGLIYSKKSQYHLANKNFQLALDNGQTDKTIYLYMAQNSFKLKAYQDTIDALNKSGELMQKNPKLIALKAECHWQLKAYDDALKMIAFGLEKYATHYDYYKQRFYYLISLELYQAALSDAQIYLQKAKASEKTTVAFIVALRKAHEVDDAIRLAEIANVRYVDSSDVTVLLAHLYLDKEMINAAAALFDEASIEDFKYTKESAEIFRRAKEYTLALYKNSQMLDTTEKYKQKIAIYLEYGDYERVVATRDSLYRSKLIENEDMRYALAYAYYMIGEYDNSEEELKQLTRSDLFTKAIELRKNMQKCQNNHWECE